MISIPISKDFTRPVLLPTTTKVTVVCVCLGYNPIIRYWQVDNVVVTVPMPKDVTGCSMTTSVGSYTFDPVSKQLRWDIGKIQPLKVPTMRGSVS